MDNQDNIITFTNLLESFKQIHVNTQKQPTFLEIAGKAQKEDVISNILAFFFDPYQPHGLGNLFYNTFMQCLGVLDIQDEVEIGLVNREVTTAQGKRIDLWIETSDCILVIENKIFHHLNNDLQEYANHARRMDRKKHYYLGVLSLYAQGKCAIEYL